MKITMEHELERQLATYTGSRKIPALLYNFFVKETEPELVDYLVFSRGKSSIIFKKIAINHLEILDIFSKYIRLSYRHGIDNVLFNQLEPYFTSNWSITTTWPSYLCLTLNYDISEKTCTNILKMGFNEATVNLQDHNTNFIMR